MPWCYAMLRGARVLARCDEDGQFVAEQGRVEIRYKPSDGRAYRAAARNLQAVAGEALLPDDACVTGEPVAARAEKKAGGRKSTASSATAAAAVEVPEGAVIAYTDGACSGNPGPCGVGVVLMVDGTRKEYSGFLGQGTNNIAELTAIQIAAEAVAEASRPVRIHTDSSYAIGVLTKGWKAKANVALIAEVAKALGRLQDVGLIHVRGHAGIPENERADQLAVAAVQARMTAGWVAVRAER